MIEEIRSSHNSLLKLAASLKIKKHRDDNSLFVVEGVRLVEEATQAGWEIMAAISTSKAYKQERVQGIVKQLTERSCRIAVIEEELYAKITDTEQPQGIMALVRKKETRLEEIVNSTSPLLAILDGVQDPGNVGSLIRTADAAGCTAVVLTAGCADVYGGKVVRATMGSLFHLPVVSNVTVTELVDWLHDNHISLAATALSSSNLYHEVDLRGSVAIVLGNEGAGVSVELLSRAEQRLHIPIHGQAESLNVAAAAAIIFYEAARQRRMAL